MVVKVIKIIEVKVMVVKIAMMAQRCDGGREAFRGGSGQVGRVDVARGRDATTGRSLLSKVCCCRLATGWPYGHRGLGRIDTQKIH